VVDWSDNLRVQLAHHTRAALERDPARPLGEASKSPPISALDSTHALVCNVFERRGPDARSRFSTALRSRTPLDRMSFVHDLLGQGESLHPAVALQFSGADARPIILHASFTEPYTQTAEPTDALPVPETGWGELQGCRNLAMELQFKRPHAHSFPIASTLRRLRTMTRIYGVRGFRYQYLWYDTADAAAARHRAHIDRLRMRIGGEIDLAAETWQAFFARLQGADGTDPMHIRYLADRYFQTGR
jgi:hypothetical protein